MSEDPQADLREAARAVGEELVKAFEQADRMARAAYDDVRRLVSESSGARPASTSTPTSEESPVDAIRQLAALRDEGLITHEEYEGKKAELLERI